MQYNRSLLIFHRYYNTGKLQKVISSSSLKEGSKGPKNMCNTDNKSSFDGSLECSFHRIIGDSSSIQKETNNKYGPELSEVQESSMTSQPLQNTLQVHNGLEVAEPYKAVFHKNENLVLPNFSHTINTNFTMSNNDMWKDDTDTTSLFSNETNNAQENTKSSGAFNFVKFERLMASQIEQKQEIMSTSLPNNVLNGENTLDDLCSESKIHTEVGVNDTTSIPPSVWAMDVSEGFLVLGCSNGKMELWETLTGKYKVSHMLHLISNRGYNFTGNTATWPPKSYICFLVCL